MYSILNCDAFTTFKGVFSDHRIVSAKNRLSLRRNKKQTIKTTRFNLFSLTKRNISNKYSVTVRNKIDTQEISERYTLNDKYENFVTAHMEAAN